MTREQAQRKYDALRNMTTARGCTPHEAQTAARLADTIGKRWGFSTAAPSGTYRPDFDQRWTRAERRAAVHFRWEYRRCGKSNCWCERADRGHGPYRYTKRREGRTVRSIYQGR